MCRQANCDISSAQKQLKFKQKLPMTNRRTAVITAIASALFVSLGSLSSADGQEMTKAAHSAVGLDGYCAVCVTKMKKWEKGKPEIASHYDGKDYYFPAAEVKAKFDASPESFVPALNGDCIVCYAKMGKRVPGSTQFSSLYKNRLYLFPSDKERKMFEATPDAFLNTDLALNGECVVCLAKMGKHVPGSADHTVIHDGLRYLFPSAKEAEMFRQSPAEFVNATSTMGKTGMKDTSSKAVRLVGRTGCAACEFGIKPLGSPDQLGLAIETNDGKVIVVEEAHKLFPKQYEDRFEGNEIAVEGHVVKTQGNVTWLKPTTLTSIN